MVASEVKEFDLRILVLVDGGVGSQIVGHVIERHSRGLLEKRIADKGDASSI